MLDNSLHPAFPMIQWDQHAIDHNDDPTAWEWKEPMGSETTLLSESQKRQLLARVQEGIYLKADP